MLSKEVQTQLMNTIIGIRLKTLRLIRPIVLQRCDASPGGNEPLLIGRRNYASQK